ncbi:hypothetical protein GOV09_03365 [Candidatus Woesearchaeota archaeon]|nr:hypothetical protein [Candidatus Woesearchaeota archaeon]
MKTKLFNRTTSLLVVILLALTALVYAQNPVEPSDPSDFTYISNSTTRYANGTVFNYTRGFIHTINIYEKAPTLKWIGYVGNITGDFALQDSDGYSLYRWNIISTTGEVYATKEGPGSDSGAGNNDESDEGGIPEWENIICANLENLTQEEILWNHTTAYGAIANEDAYLQTFKANGGADFTLQAPFYVGADKEIDGTGCYGVNLYTNDTRMANNWEEVVLMDMSWEEERAGAGTFLDIQWDIIYASLIENNTWGYRNDSQTYDFQIMLPQSGLEGSTVPNKAFYFYVELI